MSRFDVVIIGGGIAGTSLAFELSEHASVCVLDMENVFGFHTTGRSAAAFLESYGSRTVRMHVSASRAFFEDPPAGFERPLLTPRSLIWVAPESDLDQIQQLEGSVREFVPDAQVIDVDEAVRRCPFLNPDWVAAGLVEPGASDIDVNSLHQGFIKGMKARGTQTRTSARVVEITRRPDGLLHVQTEDGGEFSAPVVVNAAGAWGDRVGALAGARPVGLEPKLRNVFIIERPEVPEGYDYMSLPLVHDVAGRFYFKPESTGMLCSPADELPSDPVDAKPDMESVAEAIERINEATSLGIRSVKHQWAGLRTFLADRTPVACFDPEVEGFFWLVGQGGYGIETSPALARSAAAVLTGSELPSDLSAMGLTKHDLDLQRLHASA